MTRTARIVMVLFALVLLRGSLFVVDEMHQAVVLQFGQIRRVDRDPGLKFKLPLIQNVVMLEKRVLAWDGAPDDMTTGDKQKIWINTSARWVIVDPAKFLVSVREEDAAQGRLDDLIDGEVRKAVARHRVIDLVRGSEREMTYFDDEEDLRRLLLRYPNLDIFQGDAFDPTRGQSALPESEIESAPAPVNLSAGLGVSGSVELPPSAETATVAPDAEVEIPRPTSKRGLIMDQVTRNVTALTEKEYGIKVLDVRIKQLIYVETVRQEIYQKMISERHRVSEKFRSVGQGAGDKIRGEKLRKLKEILSEARRRSEIVRGEGDAQAARIYASAYNRDPEFYKFVKTLETYRMAVDEETELILPVQSDVFQYLIKAP